MGENKKIRIGLLWHSFTSGNLGVGALSICNLRIIDECVSELGLSADYVVMGNRGVLEYYPQDFHGRLTLVDLTASEIIRRPHDFYGAFGDLDFVFDIGEGDSFSDIYGLPRFIKSSISKFLAISRTKGLVLSPQTMGPFNTRVAKKISKWLISNSKASIARDDVSRKVIDNIQNSNSHTAIDVAFKLPFVSQKNKITNDDILKIGLNISGLLYNGGYTGGNQFGLSFDYRDFTHQLIENLSNEFKCRIHLVPHVLSEEIPVEDDFDVCKKIAEGNPNLICPEERFKSPSEAKSYISGMDFFIGARMHATIGALSSGVPVVPLAYSMKFSALFETISYRHVLDMRKTGQDEIIRSIKEKIKNIGEIENDVIKANAQVENKLNSYKTVIKNIILKGN